MIVPLEDYVVPNHNIPAVFDWMAFPETIQQYDVVVIGGGAAGVGVAIALSHAGVKNFVVLDRSMIGASFAAWPDETRFITPSFPTNTKRPTRSRC